MRTILVRVATVAAAILLASLSSLSFSPSVSARTDTLRFWGYWQAKDSSWKFATTGPAQAKPADGAVEGWRFAKAAGEAGTPPRANADFADICGSDDKQRGRKRVAVVIDYGEQSDAPQGQRPPAAKTDCAVVASDATGADVLAAVTKPQSDSKGLVCAVDSYPAGACGPAAGPAPSGAAAPAPADKPADGPSAGLIGGVVVILVVAGAGVAFAVRRRQASGA